MTRGTGQTTKQIEALPKGSLLVWCIDRLHYPRYLCETIGREDIKLVGPSWIINGYWRGSLFPAAAYDHDLMSLLNRHDIELFRNEWSGLVTRVGRE